VKETRREEFLLEGRVQGIGFRPFIFRLASSLGLKGWVRNSSTGVSIEAEGPSPFLDLFLFRIETEKPPGAIIYSIKRVPGLPLENDNRFEILPSLMEEKRIPEPFPDLATCADCLAELFNPDNRRYRYPFINCTRCGPRYSIISDLPYDRCRTSMHRFILCSECELEYHDPLDRRFHAEPNACSRCGPRLSLTDSRGGEIAVGGDALAGSVDLLRLGEILAVKGVGGFHLMGDARREGTLWRLREAKERGGKPFALMAPSITWVAGATRPSELEMRLLKSYAAPIVLISRSDQPVDLAPSVVPGLMENSLNPYLGVMLPHTPLHHLLMSELGFPLVATSGNLPGEPLCYEDREAYEKLSGAARFFLTHDRPILRPVEDSVVRVVAGKLSTLRCGRGYVPLSLPLPISTPPILGCGGETKSAIALAVGNRLRLGPPLGEIGTESGFRAYHQALREMPVLFGGETDRKACDLHPHYISSRLARESAVQVDEIQHHHAHIVSCMTEHRLDEEVLGVAWDGSGYGPDGTVWGGEFLRATPLSFSRAGKFRLFPLLGGEQAVREPRRSAFALLHCIFGDKAVQMRHLPPIQSFPAPFLQNLSVIASRRINSPLTSSAGRLFDAVASLTGLCQIAGYEGEGGRLLEFSVRGLSDLSRYSIPLREDPALAGGTLQADWEPMIREIVEDMENGVEVKEISLRFHHALAELVVQMALRAELKYVVLTGGCFQNRILAERSVIRLRSEGFTPVWHQRVPANDWGIAVGQAVIAARMKESV
jgi:hydrogenase maturation protein HypF